MLTLNSAITSGIVLLCIIFIVYFIISINNKVIMYMNAVERAWAQVIAQERQKNNVLPQLEKITIQYKDFEQHVQPQVAALRSSIGQLSEEKIDLKQLAQTQRNTSGLMSGINIAVEAYPDLKASDSYTRLMNQITQQQEEVTAAIRVFNYNVELFNNVIEIFPNSVINTFITNKKKVNTFTDIEATENFDYKPNFL